MYEIDSRALTDRCVVMHCLFVICAFPSINNILNKVEMNPLSIIEPVSTYKISE